VWWNGISVSVWSLVSDVSHFGHSVHNRKWVCDLMVRGTQCCAHQHLVKFTHLIICIYPTISVYYSHYVFNLWVFQWGLHHSSTLFESVLHSKCSLLNFQFFSYFSVFIVLEELMHKLWSISHCLNVKCTHICKVFILFCSIC